MSVWILKNVEIGLCAFTEVNVRPVANAVVDRVMDTIGPDHSLEGCATWIDQTKQERSRISVPRGSTRGMNNVSKTTLKREAF